MRVVLQNLAVAALYWIVAELTLLPATDAGRVTPMWPPAGVALAAVLLGGARLFPGVALGALVTSTIHMSAVAAVPIAAGMLLQVLIDVRLLARLQFDQRLERLRDPLVLGGVTLVGAAVAGLFGLVAVIADTGPPIADWPRGFIVWWLRDWLGAVIVVSLALTWARARTTVWTRARILEGLATIVVFLVLSDVMFGLRIVFPGQRVPLAFLFFPLVGYAGLRFGPVGAATMVALASAVILPIAALGVGPFTEFSVGFTIFVAHLFLMLGWISGHTLAAIRAEWEDALQRRLGLEEQLRHSQKMEAVGRLAGGIAHDFNNLLTAIIGYAEIVIVSLEPGDPRRADAEEIARAAMRAADLTRQMLAFSRKQVLQPKVIDLNLTVAKVEPMLRRLIGEDIIMTITTRAANPHVRVDPGQIEQVIMNLVVNARDAMPKGGRLLVETSDQGDSLALPPDAHAGPYVVLAVSDTGVGMSADVRARVFEPYFTTKDIGKGTGLGLSTAYGIVRQSEGYSQVLSEPGQGTAFRVQLPCAQAKAAPDEAVADERMPGGSEHVLLVEDDPSVRRLSRDILERLGYTVTEAASGRAGLALGSDETKHFDVALSDVILGDMTGPAVYEALRALRPNVRVLYMSGYADEAIVRTGVLEEGFPFLQKPFTPRDLATKLRDVLDRPEGT
jgi:signal transduction histidine kinase/CheY-like chemotaxis protein